MIVHLLHCWDVRHLLFVRLPAAQQWTTGNMWLFFCKGVICAWVALYHASAIIVLTTVSAGTTFGSIFGSASIARENPEANYNKRKSHGESLINTINLLQQWCL